MAKVLRTMKTMLKSIVWLCFVLPLFAEAQSRIELKNPSFEADNRGVGIVPTGWEDKGSEAETPPDIQPGFFNVELSAQHGRNYLGMTVRDNNTWEGIGQKLEGWLQKDSVYTFGLWLARSNDFVSVTRTTGEMATFKSPTILKIWGYNTQTGQEELLAESTPVSHSKWVRYQFTLRPTQSDFDEIDLMAYYAPGHERKNGHLLIDNCSAIVRIQK
jgi:hypothetical protein